MSETRYIISDAAKRVAVEPHVLRYWEEELELKIPRNEMGHRYYREKDIEILKMVKTLKDKGYQLRAIKMEVEAMMDGDKKEESVERHFEVVEGSVEENKDIKVVSQKDMEAADIEAADRMVQFRMIMSDLIGQAIRENNQELSASVGSSVAEHVVKEMDYLARDREEREDERFRRFDEVIREIQKNRQEVAAASETKGKGKSEKKKRKGFFKK